MHWVAVTRKYVTDLPLRYGHQRHAMQAILERKEEMKSAAQHLGLKSRLAAQRNEAAGDRAAEAPPFFHHREAVVGDVTNEPAHPEYKQTEQSEAQTQGVKGRDHSGLHHVVRMCN